MMKELKSYSDVKEGDYFPTISPITNLPCLAIVEFVYEKENSFYYCNQFFGESVREEGLKETILLRKTKKGLEILAGEDAFERLKPEKPLDKELIAALARVCLKM